MEDQHTWQSLVSACKQGDITAQEVLYKRYVKAMLNSSYRILNNREDAEDAVQEAFLKAFRKLHSFRGEASFGAWLKRIVINQSINLLQKRRQEWIQLGGAGAGFKGKIQSFPGRRISLSGGRCLPGAT